jgi:flagellar biosynthesis/type III secretory pathway protein FliH
MSEARIKPENSRHGGLAGLLAALQPQSQAQPVAVKAEPPAPDPKLVRAAEDAALRAEAHAAGRAEGMAEAEAALAPVLARLEAAAAAFEAACVIDADALRAPLAALVRTLCERVLGAELARGEAVLLPLVEAALAALSPGEPAVLRAAPEVIAALNDHAADVLAGLQLEADPALGDGVCVSGPTFVVETGLGARLEDVMAVLEGRA